MKPKDLIEKFEQSTPPIGNKIFFAVDISEQIFESNKEKELKEMFKVIKKIKNVKKSRSN